MGKVIPMVRKQRQVFTARSAVFHALRVYGQAPLAELIERLSNIAEVAAAERVGPIVPALSKRQISDALGWLRQRDFVRFDRSTRTWESVSGLIVPARWRDSFQP